VSVLRGRVRPWPRDLAPCIERLTLILRDPTTPALDLAIAEEAARQLLRRVAPR
jgi:hypothetical protein